MADFVPIILAGVVILGIFAYMDANRRKLNPLVGYCLYVRFGGAPQRNFISDGYSSPGTSWVLGRAPLVLSEKSPNGAVFHLTVHPRVESPLPNINIIYNDKYYVFGW